MNTSTEKPNGRGWVRLKLTFTDRVMDDKGVPPIPFKLAAALARYADAETGIVDRSQAFLADVVNVKLRALQLAVDLLAKRGHVVVLRPKGRKMGNRYRPVLRPKDDPDPVHMHGGAHEDGPFHMHGDAHGAEFHAHETAISYAPRCALNPVGNPVIDHPVSEATAERPAEAGTTTMTSDAEDGLIDDIRKAIEAAGGKLVRRRHSLQPLRALIATGIPRAEIVASVAAAASRLRAPLGNLDAPWLLDHVRDRAAADGYGTGKSEISATARPADTGPTRQTPAGFDWPEARIVAAVASGLAGGSWPDGWGPKPGRPGCEVDADLVERGRAIVVEAVRAWKAAEPWDPKIGPHPNSPSSSLAPEFVGGVQLRSGEWFTAGGLDHLLKILADSSDDFEWEFVKYFRALPSPLDAEDCTLPLEWQVKALEYRNEKM